MFIMKSGFLRVTRDEWCVVIGCVGEWAPSCVVNSSFPKSQTT